jgi:hypothetical protein
MTGYPTLQQMVTAEIARRQEHEHRVAYSS